MNAQDRHVKASALEMKMDQNHKQFLLSTLKLDMLPDDLVLEYSRIKRYTDVLSAAISPMDMIMMADRVGLLVDEYALGDTMESVPAIIAEQPATADTSGSEDKVKETVDVEKETDSSESPDTADGSWPEDALPKGKRVTVYHDMSPQEGEIVNVSHDEFGYSYDVQMDNEDYNDPIPFAESDISVD